MAEEKKKLTEEQKWPKRSPIKMLRDFAHCYDGVTQTRYENGKTYEHYGDSLLAALKNESKPVAILEGVTLGTRTSPLKPNIEAANNPLMTFLNGLTLNELKPLATKKGLDVTGKKRDEIIDLIVQFG